MASALKMLMAMNWLLLKQQSNDKSCYLMAWEIPGQDRNYLLERICLASRMHWEDVVSRLSKNPNTDDGNEYIIKDKHYSVIDNSKYT